MLQCRATSVANTLIRAGELQHWQGECALREIHFRRFGKVTVAKDRCRLTLQDFPHQVCIC